MLKQRLLLIATFWFLLALPASAQTVLTSTLTLTSANNGQTFNNYRISTTSGPCISINGGSNITISASNIGPCGGASGSSNSTDSNGVELVGASSNNKIVDNYIHNETKCTPGTTGAFHEGIYNGSSGTGNLFQGNVVAFGMQDVTDESGGGNTITGNTFINPTGDNLGCPSAGSDQGNFAYIQSPNMTVTNNYAIACRSGNNGGQGTGVSCNTVPGLNSTAVTIDEVAADGFAFHGSGTQSFQNNYSIGNGSQTGGSTCWEVFAGGGSYTFSNNIALQCSNRSSSMWDISTGTGTANNNLFFANNTGTPLGQVTIGSQFTPGVWNLSGNKGNDIDSTGHSNANNPLTNINETGDTMGAGAFPTLGLSSTLAQIEAAIGAPPLIPPSPKSCVAASPFSTQTSVPTCNTAPAEVQDCANDQVGSTTVSCTLTSPVTVNDTLIVQVRTGCNTISSVAGNSNTYQVATGLQTGPGMAYYWVPQANAGSTTVTVTVNANTCFAGLIVSEWAGMGTAPRVDGTFANTTFTAAQTQIKTGTLSATGARNEVLIGFGSTDSVQTPSGLTDYGAGGGTPVAFAHQGQTSGGGTGQTIVGAYQLSSTPASYGHQWTVTSSSISGMMMGFLSTPPIQCQAIGPNGPGAGNLCQYCPTTLTNLALYPVPAAGCQTLVENVATCGAGSAPTGSGSLQCPVCSNGSAWVGC